MQNALTFNPLSIPEFDSSKCTCRTCYDYEIECDYCLDHMNLYYGNEFIPRGVQQTLPSHAELERSRVAVFNARNPHVEVYDDLPF